VHTKPHAAPPSADAEHIAVPWPDAAGGHAAVQLPQCSGSFCTFTHAPLQFTGVAEFGSHATPQTPPAMQVAWPPSAPGHACPHEPQLAGSVGSTHVPLQSSDVGALHGDVSLPASCSGPPPSGASPGTALSAPSASAPGMPDSTALPHELTTWQSFGSTVDPSKPPQWASAAPVAQTLAIAMTRP
jgi:hypothetical protein